MSALAQAILETIRPTIEGQITHQGNWPAWAEYGMQVVYNDLKRDNRKYNVFFRSREEMGYWYTFKSGPFVALHKYQWDLGPQEIF